MWAAHIGPDPAGRNDHQRAPVVSVPGRVAAHQGIERSLAAAIDLPSALLVIGDAAEAR